jgi:hypothetical protein
MGNVEDVGKVGKADVIKQIRQLSELEDGWFDGDGEAYLEKDLDDVVDLFSKIYPEGISMPYVYATPDGSIYFEWVNNRPHMPSYEVSLGGTPCVFSYVHANDVYDYKEFDDVLEGWIYTINKILQMETTNEAV